MTARRLRSAALMCCLLGAAGVLIAVGQPWATVALRHGAGVPTSTQHLTGGGVAGGLTGLGLVGLAGVAGVVAARGRWRRLVGALVAIAGGAATVLAVGGTGRERLADLALDTAPGATVTRIDVTAWPWVALAGAVVLTIGGVLVAVVATSGATMSARYDAPTAPRDTAADAWSALDRGEDPTSDPSETGPTDTP